MYIAVCDDQIEELEKVMGLLQAWQTDRRAAVRLRSFRSAGELLDAAQRERFTLYLLDVLMPGVTGMEAAREIRSFDDAADIVFLTTSPGFAYESYGVRALEYLLKPVSAKLLFPLLDRLYQREQNPQDGLTVRSEGVLVRLPFSQLSYVEVMGKHLFFHMTDDSVHEVVGALKEYEGALLARPEFMRTHRSYIVNMLQAEKLSPAGVVTFSGRSVPVSRLLYNQLQKDYREGRMKGVFDVTFQSALDVFNYGLVLIYGLFLSVSIAGGCTEKRDKKLVALLCPVFLVLQSLFALTLGTDKTMQLYPLIVHLPLVLILTLALKKPLGVAVVSTCTAYLCCQPLRWGKNAVEALTDSMLAADIAYIVLLVGVFWLCERFLVKAAYATMTYSRWTLLLFGSLPVTYYIFDYATTVYSNALYSNVLIISEFLPTVLVTFYILFLPAFYLETQKRAAAEMQRSMLTMELEQSQLEMDALHRMETQTAVYQHDMRHHLNMLDGLLSAGKPGQAQEYIKGVQADIEAITPRRFCENQLVNLLCSSYTDKAQRQGAVLTVEARLPDALTISDTELCSLLSNGLENALRAVKELPPERRTVSLYCGVQRNKLLIEITNPCGEAVTMKDGLPVSDRGAGHGYGCLSIQTIARRNGGLCEFSCGGGQFRLQVMLPVLEHRE